MTTDEFIEMLSQEPIELPAELIDDNGVPIDLWDEDDDLDEDEDVAEDESKSLVRADVSAAVRRYLPDASQDEQSEFTAWLMQKYGDNDELDVSMPHEYRHFQAGEDA